MAASFDAPAIDDELFHRVPLGRSRAIQALSAALLGLALQIGAPQLARAVHEPTPFGCYGLPECDCCSGSDCCLGECIGIFVGCPGGAQCWYTCDESFTLRQCCDFCQVRDPDPCPTDQRCLCTVALAQC